MILETEKSRYLHILEILKQKDAKTFTQKELSKHLSVSLRKINSFINGEIFDFWLLCRYGDLLGIEIKFNYYEITKSS